MIDAATEDTLLGYDPNGNLFSFTDARDKVTSYTYNGMDRAAAQFQRATGHLRAQDRT